MSIDREDSNLSTPSYCRYFFYYVYFCYGLAFSIDSRVFLILAETKLTIIQIVTFFGKIAWICPKCRIFCWHLDFFRIFWKNSKLMLKNRLIGTNLKISRSILKKRYNMQHLVITQTFLWTNARFQLIPNSDSFLIEDKLWSQVGIGHKHGYQMYTDVVSGCVAWICMSISDLFAEYLDFYTMDDHTGVRRRAKITVLWPRDFHGWPIFFCFLESTKMYYRFHHFGQFFCWSPYKKITSYMASFLFLWYRIFFLNEKPPNK